MKKNQHNNSALLLTIFIFWPFLGFLLAIKNFQIKFNKRLILVFFIIFGLLFYINPAQDSQRRADMLKEAYLQPFEMAFAAFETLYDKTLDFVEPILVFIVSRFSDYHGVLFAVYALIFGSLMIYYIESIYQHYIQFTNKNSLIFLVLLVFVNPINNINGFRMWTAAWIYAVGVINFINHSKWRYFIFTSTAIFVHFSFAPLVVLLLIYKFAGNRSFIYGMLAIITFFIAELDIKQLQTYASYISPATELKINAYTNEDYIEKVNLFKGQYSWFISLNEKGILYFTVLFLILIFIRTRGNFKTRVMDNFYSFTLLVLSFANISALLPSGGRFYIVYNIFVFTLGVIYYIYEKRKSKLDWIQAIGLPISFLFVILNFRLFTDPASIYLFGPSFFMPIAFVDNVSLQSILFK